MKKSLLAVLAAALTVVFTYVDVAAAATGGSAYKAGEVVGKILLAALVVFVVVAILRRVKARSNTEG